MSKSVKRIAYLVFILCLALILSGCANILDQAADALLQEWNSQQQTSEVPELWTVPPDETDMPQSSPSPVPAEDEADAAVVFGEDYSQPEDVAEYLHQFGVLPPNFITKNEAQRLGWDASAGNLRDVAPGKSIGGDHFGNREGKLPAKSGRSWFECDVNYEGGHRGAERILYSSDGLIFYTTDHYNSFTQLY